MSCSVMRLAVAAIAVAILAGNSVTRVVADPVTFEFANPVDLGSNLNRIGSVEWSHVLGTDWNTDFQFGGFIGAQNSVVIPEVRIFDNVIIPQITADTRTGARMTGNVAGSTGLEFYANFHAGGLEPGAAFDFRPAIVNLPSQVSSGEFVKLPTNPGVVPDAGFTESKVDLPSFEAGMNFFFNLDVDSKLEYALFPFVPYSNVPFKPDPISVNQSLLKFAFDFDPDSNEGKGLPPTFIIFEDTPFEERLGLLDNDESLYEKQLSVQMGAKDDPVKRRLDIGSVQLVNPFGVGDSILGPEERNLTVKTATDDSSIKFSYETPLVRLGLDLDGIAAYLLSTAVVGVGDSFTRIEKKFANDKVNLVLDVVDVKYGPEFGFRETVEIQPDFNVMVSFDQTVALKQGDTISLANSFTGRWSELPEIGLLGDQPVEATVSFDQLTGEQTKRSVIYVTDYVELTLLELEELKFSFDLPGGQETLDIKLSAPPLLQKRTSVVGALLKKQIELPVFDQTQAITPFGGINGPLATGSFTLTPTPSKIVYWAGGSDFSTSPNAWRELATHTAPATLQDAVLVIASGNSSAQVVSDLRGELLRDTGGGLGVTTSVAGLVIPRRAELTQSGARTWSLSKVVNDGLYETIEQGFTRFTGSLLTITGQGLMTFDGTLELEAGILIHGPDHTISLRDGRSIGGEMHRITAPQFENAGTIVMERGSTEITIAQRFTNSGRLHVANGGVHLIMGGINEFGLPTSPFLANDGLIDVSGSTSSLTIMHAAPLGGINVESSSGSGQIIARDGGRIQFASRVSVGTRSDNPQPMRFHATTGGTIRFDRLIVAGSRGVAELHVDAGSKMILNGVRVNSEDAQVSLVNRGLVEVQSGFNRLYFTEGSRERLDPPPEGSEIVGINIINEGTIRIQPHPGGPDALFGFEAEIVNYVPGGATLGPGAWEVIGQVPTTPYHNDGGAFDGSGAVLEIVIARISNDELYLGRIDFGDTNGDGVPDGYSAEDYDTHLAISEANVLLSGAARFDYFNTIRENRGSFTLRNKNYFDTAGGLVNKGTIRIEAESRLNVFGDFTVDEGTVFVDSTSTLDVKSPNTLEVIGGTLTVQRGAEPLFVNTPWIVREKWLGVDEEGNDIVREARVSYGGAWFPTIGPNADILLEGKQAVFEPLARLNRIQGKLALMGGNELQLAQSLNNQGTLRLATAGKLYVDGSLATSGELVVGHDTYLEVNGSIDATDGSVELDGVVHTPNLTTAAGTILSGTGRLTGSLDHSGTFRATIAEAGFDANMLLVDGQTTLDGSLQLMLDGYIPTPADTFSILHAAEGLVGGFTNIATGLRLPTSDGIGSFLIHYGIGSPFDPNHIVLTAFEPTGDYNGDGTFDAADYVVWRKHDGSQQGYNIWRANFGRTAGRGSDATGPATAAVPEPASAWLLMLAAVAGNLKRRRIASGVPSPFAQRVRQARPQCTRSAARICSAV